MSHETQPPAPDNNSRRRECATTAPVFGRCHTKHPAPTSRGDLRQRTRLPEGAESKHKALLGRERIRLARNRAPLHPEGTCARERRSKTGDRSPSPSSAANESDSHETARRYITRGLAPASIGVPNTLHATPREPTPPTRSKVPINATPLIENLRRPLDSIVHEEGLEPPHLAVPEPESGGRVVRGGEQTSATCFREGFATVGGVSMRLETIRGRFASA